MSISQKLAEASKLQHQNFTNLKSKDFSFQHNELKFNFRDSLGNGFKFYWEKENGLLMSTHKAKELVVKLRDLDQ
jgi:hypothetical protein